MPCFKTQFSNLTSLRFLDLSCANLVADLSSISISLTLPPKMDFGSMFSFIRYGELSSPNLSWLEGLRGLRYLVLTGVDLSKASESFHWAKPISTLSNLMTLQLSKCKISGRIPTGQLLNLTKLSTLEMISNVLTSPIPDLLSNLTSISVLDFSGNDLHGHIPYLPQLEKLNVSINPAMTIDLVSMFSVPWSKLTFLDISFARVGGTIPPPLSNSTSSTFFRADRCSIQGSVPSSVTKLEKLSILMLNDNDITEIVTKGLTHWLESVSSYNTGFDVSSNALTGKIPEKIGLLSGIPLQNLSHNNLTGVIPKTIGEMISPESLDLSYNHFTCEVPLTLTLLDLL
ncbi:hypothetical protein K7X08_016999 [Anisodus acutangulus]|uniref:Uncharacterized protein n=1 Tax=Anisodus acutangulus TaxID=402998 RepID=A0A9Q1R5Y2_9SOLA|nr:hypothetical protein K7X08_016999 [Anisodus acutangulus]